MQTLGTSPPESLGLRAGDWVEVRSAEEILSTLDGRGRLDGLPFMPEMLAYCGKRIRVFKSAHKTCDTIAGCKSRSMRSAVHLEGVRCGGDAHGGCQAGCLVFWKEAWLKRAPRRPLLPRRRRDVAQAALPPTAASCTFEMLERATRPADEEGAEAGAGSPERYSCQITELRAATTPLSWWDPRQYVKDLTSKNVPFHKFVFYAALALYNHVLRSVHRGSRLRYPRVRGHAHGHTPASSLNLVPGDLVKIRSKREIMETINGSLRNRGLLFDVEMLPFCGQERRVLRKVDRIIDEKTGVMMRLPGPCLILDGVSCGGCLSTGRLFCPRSIYSYWHEVWLERIEAPKLAAAVLPECAPAPAAPVAAPPAPAAPTVP